MSNYRWIRLLVISSLLVAVLAVNAVSVGLVKADDDDVTVDHKKPRSKYPSLALKRDNLRVLCRVCNSRKGAGEWIEV